jgi:hypothetical protein
MTILAVPVRFPMTYERHREDGEYVSRLTTAAGIVRLERGGLVLEWAGSVQVTPTVRLPNARTEPIARRERTVPLARLAGARVGGWLRRRLELRAVDLDALDGVPGAEAGRVTLHVAWGDRALAAALVDAVEEARADAVLRASDAWPELPGDR